MNNKQQTEHIVKMLGDLCQSACDAVEADSLIMIVNKGKGTAVISGCGPNTSQEDMIKSFKMNAAEILELANNMENGSVKYDGKMYLQEKGKIIETSSLNRDEPPDICSFGL